MEKVKKLVPSNINVILTPIVPLGKSEKYIDTYKPMGEELEQNLCSSLFVYDLNTKPTKKTMKAICMNCGVDPDFFFKIKGDLSMDEIKDLNDTLWYDYILPIFDGEKLIPKAKYLPPFSNLNNDNNSNKNIFVRKNNSRQNRNTNDNKAYSRDEISRSEKGLTTIHYPQIDVKELMKMNN